MNRIFKFLSIVLIIALVFAVQSNSTNVNAETVNKSYLTLDSNMGVGSLPTIPDPVEGVYTMPISGALTKTNYRFLGWNTRADGAGINYVFGDTITLTSDTTLYANWAPTDSKTVAFTFTPTSTSEIPNPESYKYVIVLNPQSPQNPEMAEATVTLSEENSATSGTIRFNNLDKILDIYPGGESYQAGINLEEQSIKINSTNTNEQFKYHIFYFHESYNGSSFERSESWNLMLTLNKFNYAGIIAEGSTYSPDRKTIFMYSENLPMDIYFGSQQLLLSLNNSTGRTASIESVSIDNKTPVAVSEDKSDNYYHVDLPPISSPVNEIEVNAVLDDGSPVTTSFSIRRTGVSVNSFENEWGMITGGDPFDKTQGYIGSKWEGNYKDFVTYVTYSAYSLSPIVIEAPRLIVTYFQDSGSSTRVIGTKQFDLRTSRNNEYSIFDLENQEPYYIDIRGSDSDTSDDYQYFVDRFSTGASSIDKMTNSIAFHCTTPYSSGVGSQTDIMVFSTLFADNFRGVPGPQDFPGANRISVFLIDSPDDVNLVSEESFVGIQYGVGAGVEGLMVNNPSSKQYTYWDTGNP